MVTEQIHERLDTLKEEYGDFRVARHHPDDSTQLDPYLYNEVGERVNVSAPWIYSDTTICERNVEYNHRAIMPFEVVWECDDENIMKNIIKGLRVYERLLSRGIKSSAWFTGGKSLHVHAFFKPDARLKNERFFKQYLWHQFKEGDGWDKGLVMGRHLIRMEHGLHELSGMRKLRLIGEENVIVNTLDETMVQEMEVAQLKYEMNMARHSYKESINKGIMPGCIQAFYDQQFRELKDGRKRALFILAATLTQCTDQQTAYDRLMEWNKLVGAGYSEAKINSMMRHVMSSNRYMTCLYRHEFFNELQITFHCNKYITPEVRKNNMGETPCAIEETVRT